MKLLWLLACLAAAGLPCVAVGLAAWFAYTMMLVPLGAPLLPVWPAAPAAGVVVVGWGVLMVRRER